MNDFTGRVGVVTGAGNGLGRALAVALGDQGASVVVADVEVSAAEETAELVRTAGGTATAVAVDVSSWPSMQELASRTLEAYGSVDLVCNNAGVSLGAKPVSDLSLNDWAWTMDVNLWGVIHGIQTFLPILRSQGSGHLVNTASAGSLSGMGYAAPYCASKAAVLSLSESLYFELADEGLPIVVSVVLPAAVQTTLSRSEERRPAHLRDETTSPGAPSAGEERLRAVRATGISPAEAAEQVLQGIREDRFYIFTHPGFEARAGRRLADIRAGRGPSI